MVLDYLLVGIALFSMTVLRPTMSNLPFIANIPSTTWLPVFLYFLFPGLWVVIYSAASLYDGKKYLRISDELAGLSVSSIIAAICLAGILFLSYREVSRALFLAFAAMSFVLCVAWRLVARLVFRLRQQHLTTTKRILIIGDPVSGKQLLKHLEKNPGTGIQSVRAGFPFDKEKDAYTRLQVYTIRQTLVDEEITDLVISIPADDIHKINELLEALDDLPLNIWVGLDFLDLSFA